MKVFFLFCAAIVLSGCDFTNDHDNEAIEAAVRMTIAKGYRTADIYSAAEGELLVGCDEMTSAILENIK